LQIEEQYRQQLDNQKRLEDMYAIDSMSGLKPIESYPGPEILGPDEL